MNKRIVITMIVLAIILPIIWFVEYIPMVCPPSPTCGDLNFNGVTSFAEQMKAWEFRPKN